MTPTSPQRLGPSNAARPPLVGGAFLAFLLVWPVLWSNAKIADAGDPGRWLSLPAEVRFMEPLVIATALILAFLFGTGFQNRLLNGLVRWLAVLGVAGVVGSVLAFPGILNALYGTYDIAVAFVLLVTALALQYDRSTLIIVMRYLVVICLLNWIVGVEQAVVVGVQADRIHGLYDDANTMSTVFYIFSAYCLYRHAVSRSVPHLVFGLFLIPMAYLGFNEKLNLFFWGWMLPLVFLRLRKSPIRMAVVAVAGVVLIVSTVGLAARSGLTGRTTDVSDLVGERGGLLALGVIRSWPMAWSQIEDQSVTVLFGRGASSFGGAVAASRFNNGTASPITNEIFQFQTSTEYLGAFDSPTNYFSNALAEFGVVGLVAVVALLGRIVLTLHRVGRLHSDPDLVAWAWAAKWGWIIVAMQAFFVPFGAFGNLAVMAPLALATAAVVSEATHVGRAAPGTALLT